MPYFSQVARNTPFDNSTNGFSSDNTQEAIEEIRDIINLGSKSFIFSNYNGNANTGRYLEFFSGIASNEAPVRVINGLYIITVVARTTAVDATCTIGFYNIQPAIPVLLYTLTFNAQKEVVATSPSPGLFSIPDGGELAIKIDSGSIAKPHLYFTGQGG